MSMTRPIGSPINAFDATTNHTFYFTSSGGNQVVYNRIIIRNNTTNVIVYNNLVESYKFEHIVPSGTLTNGVYYNYTITTYDVSSNASEPSSPIAFYCYSSPTITFTNIPVGNIIQASSFTFNVTYDQAQDELLDTLTINLYNASGVLIDSSVGLHNSGNPPLDFSYTFNGFTDDTIYKISASAVSVNGTVTNSPMIQFITSYFSPTMYSILELTNSCSGGYVEIKNNMIIIEGESFPSPPTYIGGTEVDLSIDGTYVRWVEGYNITNGFTMGLWGRSYTRNVPICTLANANNGKIVIKFIDDYPYGETTLKTVAELTVYDISNNPQYTIYSNYIETTDIANDVFIWVRRINNIFEIKVEV